MQFYFKDIISLLDDDLVFEVGMKLLFIDYLLDGYCDYNDYEIDGEEGYGL